MADSLRKCKKVKLNFFDKNIVFAENGNLEVHFVNLSVSNIGNRNVVVEGWGIKVSREKVLLFMPDIKNPIYKAIQKPLPYILEPEQSIDLVFDLKMFIRNLRNEVEKGVLKESNKITVYISDSTGKKYYLKSKKTIQQYIADDAYEGKAKNCGSKK